MKKIKLGLFLTISSLVITSCANQSSKKEDNPPKEHFNFNRTHYEYIDEEAEDTVEGAPWINSNISSYVDAIEQPSIKDDFYAHVNYDDLTSGGLSLFDSSAYIARDNLSKLFSEDGPSYTDKSTVSYLMEHVSLTTDDDLINYIRNLNCDYYLNTKEALTLPSSLIKLFLRGDKEYVCFNYGLDISLPLLGIYAFYGFYSEYYVMYKDQTIALYDTLFDILGYSLSDEEVEEAVYFITGIYYSAYQYSGRYGEEDLAVADIVKPSVKNALLDYGFDDSHQLTYLTSTSVYLEQLMDSQYYEMAIKANLLFDYRFLIGAETYNRISRTIINLNIFDYDFTTNGLEENSIRKNLARGIVPVIINLAYIHCYKNDELKENIANTIDEVISGYKDLVNESEWMNAACKRAFKKKLNKVRTFSLYSDILEQAGAFNFDTSSVDYLRDIYNAYAKYTMSLSLSGILDDTNSTDAYIVNAFYQARTNSFVILLGLAADENWYSEEKELLYARVAFVIAHEMSHGFDPNCIVYNEDGQENRNWGDSDARAEYKIRTKKMISFYNKIHYFDDFTMDGDHVKGEAFADLGAMSVVLNMAKKIDGFDYDIFFKEYAKTWLDIVPIQSVDYYLDDTHPLPYIRTNSVVCQFQEFIDTYDIQPGDGMYMPASERIAVLTD